MIRKSAVSLAVLSAFIGVPAHAEGYKLFEQSVSSMGNAYAGRGAQITDASLVYSNPAAITELDGAQLSGGLNLISAQTNYRNASARSANGQSVVGRTEGANSLNELVPFMFYADKVSEQLSWGIGFYAPFGLSSDYDDDFVGRYFADETAVQVVSLQPALAYKLNERISVGVGISLNHAEGTLSKFKDHSGLCEAGPLLGAIFNDAICASHYEVEGDDIAFGYSLGIYAEPIDGTRLALTWHSAVDYSLKGDSVITNTPVTIANGAPYLVPVPGMPQLPLLDARTGKLATNDKLVEKSKLDLTTPASAAFSLDQQLTAALSLQFSAAWTQWSKFQSIDIVSNDTNPSISLSTQREPNLNSPGYIGYIPEYWHNSWSFALGATYVYQKDLTLKTGVAFDENPISQRHKTARIPTDDRVWLTVGANWQLSDKLSLDFAYGYLFTGDVSVDEHEYNVQDERLYNSGFQGQYSNKGQLIAVQANYRF
ncbi:MAG: outer membrane protein transport protein [Gammaproteobacteria bacterium]|nr:outer membrane protein transport protein [Gammaproteobacteria bacterium]MBU2184637.1 outer membrane protein transport protein [Gammaproteobacteria bacterium]MBU2205697.1 outer membrane protein transport protein [Gammaproteobacteria bacterium]